MWSPIKNLYYAYEKSRNVNLNTYSTSIVCAVYCEELHKNNSNDQGPYSLYICPRILTAVIKLDNLHCINFILLPFHVSKLCNNKNYYCIYMYDIVCNLWAYCLHYFPILRPWTTFLTKIHFMYVLTNNGWRFHWCFVYCHYISTDLLFVHYDYFVFLFRLQHEGRVPQASTPDSIQCLALFTEPCSRWRAAGDVISGHSSRNNARLWRHSRALFLSLPTYPTPGE